MGGRSYTRIFDRARGRHPQPPHCSGVNGACAARVLPVVTGKHPCEERRGTTPRTLHPGGTVCVSLCLGQRGRCTHLVTKPRGDRVRPCHDPTFFFSRGEDGSLERCVSFPKLLNSWRKTIHIQSHLMLPVTPGPWRTREVNLPKTPKKWLSQDGALGGSALVAGSPHLTPRTSPSSLLA